ncbi:lysylphosphatidylglycerol synthase domain-containing protein [Clostridium sp. Marseille-P2415]|uniref:lysylphosphatidylglycerol synthase domain-containing protein n=1 Tax=Clostridium sp. Marseille-P2415 TaxID=1805471 RepID=UPI0009885DD8|nr:lysylphosphatidylglycerol synthase domain-containing protein [Clostridium sp. Marseille-P2415]
MKISAFIKKHNLFVNGLLFLTVALLTGYTIFHGNNIADLIKSMRQVSLLWLILCAAAALLFICAESLILWILLKQKDKKTPILRCFQYSLVGYFYSGIRSFYHTLYPGCNKQNI